MILGIGSKSFAWVEFLKVICKLVFLKRVFFRSDLMQEGWSWESVRNPRPGWRGRRMSGRHSRASISQDLWGFAQVKITVFGGG